jgi:membrane protease subunit HflC
MKKLITVALLLCASIIIFVTSGPLYVVEEGEQAVVIRFGKIIGQEKTAGLQIKVPFLDNVNKFPTKILSWDGESQRIPTEENQFIWVDTTARWKITNPKLFYESVGNITAAQSRLDDVVDSAVRKIITRNLLTEAVRNSNVISTIKRNSPYQKAGADKGEKSVALGIDTSVVYRNIQKGRTALSKEMFKEAGDIIPQYGIELIDILIRQIKYSDELTPSVYGRMIKERNQIAQAFRSDGEGEKAAILGEMQRKLDSIRSGAYKQSETIKGEADRKAAAIYTAAYASDPDFYEFWKAVESYRTLLPNFRKTLTTQPEYFKYLYNRTAK